MTIYVHRPGTPKTAPPPTLGKSIGYLHNASGGQLGCLVGLLTVFVLFIIVVIAGNDAFADDDGTLGLVVIGAVTLAIAIGRNTDRHNAASRGPVVLAVNSDSDDERRLKKMVDDAMRFELMVERAGLIGVSNREIEHVGWVLWHAGIRTNLLGALSKTIRDAGDHVTGAAKAAWLEARKDEVVALRRPVMDAAQQVSQLADLAEDVVFAAELAREAGLGAGELYGTLGLDLPQPFDIAGSDAIEEATDRLRAWHRTWVELDEGLRAAAEAVRRRDS